MVLLTAGVSYQLITRRNDAVRFPQEGRSVDVGGYKLNINCKGQGSPTVVLEAGLGVPAISWRAVQAGVAKFTRVCSYDRAGYDWSDPGPMPRTTAQNVKELHTLLQNAGEKPPYVMVGHSFGGTEVRIYSSRYFGEVEGLILVDPGHEDLKFPDDIQKMADAELRRRQRDKEWGPLLYWFGVNRLISSSQIDRLAPSDPEPELRYFVIQPKFIAAASSESENLKEGRDELRRAGTLGDKPLIILIAGDSQLDLPVSPEERAEINFSWIEAEKRLASLSSRGKWVMLPDAGHMVPFEHPDGIIKAARELCLGTPTS